MALCNQQLGEISHKIVYCGCGLSGKTSNLEQVYQRVDPAARGELIRVADKKQAHYFEFLALSVGAVKGIKTRLHLYAVSAEVSQTASLKLVLQGVDGIVFVIDSQVSRLDENVNSYLNLCDNLVSQGIDLSKLAVVLQMNKLDLGSIFSASDLHELFNQTKSPLVGACALTGAGVMETLNSIYRQVMTNNAHLYRETSREVAPTPEAPARRSSREEPNENQGATEARLTHPLGNEHVSRGRGEIGVYDGRVGERGKEATDTEIQAPPPAGFPPVDLKPAEITSPSEEKEPEEQPRRSDGLGQLLCEIGWFDEPCENPGKA